MTTWHQRLGHLGYQTLSKMVKEDQTIGLNINGECKVPASLCYNCEFGKFSRQPLKTGRHRASRIGELTHSDVWGPISTTSLGGARYFVTFKDDFSGYITIYFMKKKNEVPALIRLYHAMLLNETGYYMLTLRSDNGKGEYVNKENAEWFSQQGIRHETSAPHTPEQNGSAERLNRTLLESVRCMIIESGMPAYLWAEATSYTAYIKNRVLSRTGQLTPYEYWNERKPDMTNFRIFGSKVFVRNPIVSSKLPRRIFCWTSVGRQAIEGKWILKHKPGFKTTAPRYKARFVIKGFSQVHGVDYNETYAPVAKTYSFRIFMAIAAARDLEMITLDVKTAFLYGTLEEEVYMHQPEGFVIPGREEEVCHLIKSIYGLKQASRVWNVKFNEFIISFGL
jgi:hypothetical protein